MWLARSTLLLLSFLVPITITECVHETCSVVPDQPHEGICDPLRT